MGQGSIHSRQFVEGLADPGQLPIMANDISAGGCERREFELPTTLDGEPVSDVIDDESTHDSRRVCHKAATIRKRRALLSGHLQVCLMDQRGCAQAYLTLMGKLVPSQPVQFPIEVRK